MLWTRVCTDGEIPDGEGRRFVLQETIAVFNVNGEFFATIDICSHGESSLSEGYVEPDCTLECVSHMARFSLRTGQVLAPPATVPIQVFPAKVEDGTVYVSFE